MRLYITYTIPIELSKKKKNNIPPIFRLAQFRLPCILPVQHCHHRRLAATELARHRRAFTSSSTVNT